MITFLSIAWIIYVAATSAAIFYERHQRRQVEARLTDLEQCQDRLDMDVVDVVMVVEECAEAGRWIKALEESAAAEDAKGEEA